MNEYHTPETRFAWHQCRSERQDRKKRLTAVASHGSHVRIPSTWLASARP